ncbi:MAG: sugar phosphate nucleotidyltransferase [Myxococcota bacterium]
MRAMVLAAGLGTRLRPLTLERPKPAVPVGNRPLMCFSLDVVARLAVDEVVVNTHHLGQALPAWIDPHAPAALELTFVHEPELLGTGGGLRNAWPLLRDGDDPVVVLNGDILFEPDLARALETHRRLDALATMVLRPDPDADRYGAVEIDGEGRVRRLLGQPAHAGPLAKHMFTGVHILSPRAFAELPEQGCIVRRSYRPWVDRGEVIAGHVDRTPWLDLGTPAAYLAANLDLARGDARWTAVPEPDARGLVHPQAHVEPGARVRGAVIGAGARVEPGADLERVVVWDGARAGGRLRDAVVTRERVVPIPRP